jgi:hypothetical protein
VSCECCGCDGEFEPTDQNVFEISKEEYKNYLYGRGIWKFNANINMNLNFDVNPNIGPAPIRVDFEENQSFITNQTVNITIPSNSTKKCAYSFYVEFQNYNIVIVRTTFFPRQETITYNEISSLNAQLNVSLKNVNKKYYLFTSLILNMPFSIGLTRQLIRSSSKPTECIEPNFDGSPININQSMQLDSNQIDSCFTNFSSRPYVLTDNVSLTSGGTFNVSVDFTPS